jgi:predicted secreted hydrolase
VEDTGVAIELTIADGGRIVSQGEAGLSRKGEGNASYYYSMTRLPVRGTIQLDEANIAVQGLGWLDREWSTSVLGPAHEGWDWFALQLDDGTDVMVYRLRRHDGSRDPFDAGKLVYADGQDETLSSADFRLTPADYWTDPAGVAWPRRWQLSVAGRQLTITAAVDDQLMDTAVRYWEGLVHVADIDGRRLGQGYMELTGYR